MDRNQRGEDYWLGVDLGGTRIKTVAVLSRGGELERKTFPTLDDGLGGFRDGVQRAAELYALQWGPPTAIGLSAPGLARGDNRAISYMPGRLQGLEGLEWEVLLGHPTRVFNDAHAALAGEAHSGAARGKNHAFMLTLGTGVGGAILADGRILQGSMGRAGHLGHICLDMDGAPDIVNTPGSLEDLVGDHSILRRSGGRFASTEALVAAASSGDAAALAIWHRSVRALACAIASLINVLDPEVVILGGGITAAGPALLDPLGVELESLEWRPGGHRVPIVPAQLGDYAGAIGAAFLAGQHLQEK